jgi:2-phosphosulfolactate phosphatase
MDIRRASNETCGAAVGAVVVIDVIRAFTTAAFALASGATEIMPVETIEEAFALRRRFSGSVVTGEVGGFPVDGFDFGNSPTALLRADLRGRRIIQRTSAGTQGLVRSRRAKPLLAASFVCASATVRYLQKVSPSRITMVETGHLPPTHDGDEDVACADYLEALLRGQPVDPGASVARVRSSRRALLFDGSEPAFPASDLDLCTQVDRFDFAMLAEEKDGLLVVTAVP